MSPTLQKPSLSLHALSCGHFTLPEYQFVQPVSRDARKTVPSLAFLIQHRNVENGKITRILFDLGLRRDVARYSAPIQKHIQSRQPMTTDPDVVKSLAKGGLTPQDIDYVLYSHVHWDHVGEPQDFQTSTFIVGHGSLSLMDGSSSSLHGGHSFFEKDLLPVGRTLELSDPSSGAIEGRPIEQHFGGIYLHQNWRPSGLLPETLDIFNDGSLLIVDAPGHLLGHVNLLARVSEDQQVYLGADACHDRRLLMGKKDIGEWNDAEGNICCIHTDKRAAKDTIQRIRELEQSGIEVILAHDDEWENAEANKRRFFGANM